MEVLGSIVATIPFVVLFIAACYCYYKLNE